MKPPLKRALVPFGESIFTPMSRLAHQAGAVNLGQGFPDFDGPDIIVDAALEAMRTGQNQYAPSHGVARLRHAIAAKVRRFNGLVFDAEAEVTVFSGATEAIFSSIMALVEAGEEVVVFEPYYDSYPACAAMAGGRCRFVPLEFPDFALEGARLEEALNERTKLIVLNTPMNPSGKVFTREELEVVADLAIKHDAYVLSDEVYEHLTFDGADHVPIASLPGMRERTVTVSSTGKTFSMTGWKVGWALAPPPLSRAVRASHQFVTYSTATPLQHAMAVALEQADDYYDAFRDDYLERRDLLLEVLREAGFNVLTPRGTYFALADITPFGFDDDRVFCEHMIRSVGVAAIPPSYFYHQRRAGKNLARFAFCKTKEAIIEAGKRLKDLKNHLGTETQ